MFHVLGPLQTALYERVPEILHAHIRFRDRLVNRGTGKSPLSGNGRNRIRHVHIRDPCLHRIPDGRTGGGELSTNDRKGPLHCRL